MTSIFDNFPVQEKFTFVEQNLLQKKSQSFIKLIILL